MKVRTVLLALLLLDLAAGATWFAGRYGADQGENLRLFLAWALPGLVFLCGVVTRERRRALPDPRTGPAMPGRLRLPGIPLPALPPVRPELPLPRVGTVPPSAASAPAPVAVFAVPWPRLLLWIGVAIAIDLAPIAIGLRAGWLLPVAAGGASLALRSLWMLPLSILVLTRFHEGTLRGQLFRGARESLRPAAAWGLSLLCGTALALPSLAPGFAWPGAKFLAAALVVVLAREIACTVLYRASGLVAAGLLRGVLTFVDLVAISDGRAPVEAAIVYAVEDPVFYLMRATSPLVAALLLARFLLRPGGRTLAVSAPAVETPRP